MRQASEVCFPAFLSLSPSPSLCLFLSLCLSFFVCLSLSFSLCVSILFSLCLRVCVCMSLFLFPSLIPSFFLSHTRTLTEHSYTPIFAPSPFSDLIVCVDEVAASGGYMMTSVANTIVASPFAMLVKYLPLLFDVY